MIMAEIDRSAGADIIIFRRKKRDKITRDAVMKRCLQALQATSCGIRTNTRNARALSDRDAPRLAQQRHQRGTQRSLPAVGQAHGCGPRERNVRLLVQRSDGATEKGDCGGETTGRGAFVTRYNGNEVARSVNALLDAQLNDVNRHHRQVESDEGSKRGVEVFQNAAGQRRQSRAEGSFWAFHLGSPQHLAQAERLPAYVSHASVDHRSYFVQEEGVPPTALALKPENSSHCADAIRPNARNLPRKNFAQHDERLESVGLRNTEVTGKFSQLALQPPKRRAHPVELRKSVV